MGRIDCSLTLNFVKEFTRMCKNNNSKVKCDNCLFKKIGCSPFDFTQEHIDILQKWSDEHPVRDSKKELLALKTIRKVWEVEPKLKNVAYMSRDGSIDGTEIPEIINNMIERLEGGADNDT